MTLQVNDIIDFVETWRSNNGFSDNEKLSNKQIEKFVFELQEKVAKMEYAKAYPELDSKYLSICSVENYDPLHKNELRYCPLTEKEKGVLEDAKNTFENKNSSKQTREAHEKNCSELIGNYYSRNYLDVVRNREREKLWRGKPMLATAFEYLDEKQYNEIILKNQTQKLNNAERQAEADIKSVYDAKKEEGRSVYEEGIFSQKDAASIPFTGDETTDYAIQKV